MKNVVFLILSTFVIMVMGCKIVAKEFADPESDKKVIDLSSGLIAYYPLDSVNKANDLSGHKNNAVSYTGIWAKDRFGHLNKAFWLRNKNTDRLDIPDFLNTTITISLWYYFEDNNDYYNTLLAGADDVNGACHHLMIKADYEVGYMNYGAFVGSGNYVETDDWYHFVVVKEGTSQKIYLNGKKILNNSDSFNNAVRPLRIIGNNTGGDDGSLGKIDDVRIYDHALDEDVILGLFNFDQDKAG